MRASGINPDNKLVEIFELPEHPFFIAGQFHPELKSTVANPHPLFVSFVAAAMKRAAGVAQQSSVKENQRIDA